MYKIDQLTLGEKYSKKSLANLLDEPALNTVREGVFSCRNSPSYILFVDLEKEGKDQRFHFNDFFEEDFFHWDSQTTQHIDSPKIQQIINQELDTYLFVRQVQKIKSKTQPFTFCGRLIYKEHDPATSKPVHIVFNNTDYDDFTENEDLINIYLWRPSKVGMTSSTAVTKRGVVSDRRKTSYKAPDKTERQGLVTSRVGQGYFRTQLIEKFDDKCAVTGSGLHKILIASHIVPWKDATEEERLDVNNGLLLSPLYDALFDKHLISFDSDGAILISDSIAHEMDKLGIDGDESIQIDMDMEPYLMRHRQELVKS